MKENSTEPRERENVTVYYQEHPESFHLVNVSSDAVFNELRYQKRTDIELVLDEAGNYLFLNRLFSALPPHKQDIRSILDYIDENDLIATSRRSFEKQRIL